MRFDLMNVVGFLPVVEFRLDEDEFDIRDFRIKDIRLGAKLELVLLSEDHHLVLTFLGANIVEDHGIEVESAMGTWLLSISRPASFDIETGRDTLSFSLDFAGHGSWVLTCVEAAGVLRNRVDQPV
jgi:hypothetical protein